MKPFHNNPFSPSFPKAPITKRKEKENKKGVALVKETKRKKNDEEGSLIITLSYCFFLSPLCEPCSNQF